MNWIKQNTFLFALAAVTIVGAAALWMLGSGAAGRYDKAKELYQTALEEAMRHEKLDPYPSAEHLESKKLAVAAYAEGADELQKAFAAYRPETLEDITVQAFSSAVKQANKETRAAFGKNTTVPDEYFCGFEVYRTALPPGNATGILNYQLQATKKVMLNLAEAGATELVSLHRPKLEEEEGKKFEPTTGQVARAMPMEVVFKGSEAAVRQFLSSLVNDKEHYMVVRSLRIANEKLIPPRKTDARFSDRPARRPGGDGDQGGSESVDFSSLFGGDAQQPAPPTDGVAPQANPQAPVAPVPPVAAPTTPADNSRILAQVLGQEQIQVFLRLDMLLFLEPKELP